MSQESQTNRNPAASGILKNWKLLSLAVVSCLISACTLDRSGIYTPPDSQTFFYGCDPNSWNLDLANTSQNVNADNTIIQQKVRFTADCVLTRYDPMEVLDGSKNLPIPFENISDTAETVIFEGEYNYDQSGVDWLPDNLPIPNWAKNYLPQKQSYTRETVRRQTGEVLYEGIWFCNNNPWLSWFEPVSDQQRYMCDEKTFVTENFLGAYGVIDKYGYQYNIHDVTIRMNDHAHWVHRDSADDIKRVPRSARFVSAGDRFLIVDAFGGEDASDFNPGSNNGSAPYIHSPAEYQVLPEDYISFDITTSPGDSSGRNVTVAEVQWSRIIEAPDRIGDIALPNAGVLWEEPTNGPKYLWLNNGIATIESSRQYFDGNQPGLYRFSLRNNYGPDNAWSTPAYFWIGEPTFDIPGGTIGNSSTLSASALNDVRINSEKISLKDKQGRDLQFNLIKKSEQSSDSTNLLSMIPGIQITDEKMINPDSGYTLPTSEDLYIKLISSNLDRAGESHDDVQIRLSCLPESKCTDLSNLVVSENHDDMQQLKISLPGHLRMLLKEKRVRLVMIMDKQLEDNLLREMASGMEINSNMSGN